MREPPHSSSPSTAGTDLEARIHRWVAICVTAAMLVDLALLVFEGQWLNAFLIFSIIAVILGPRLMGDLLPVRVPVEFQAVALVFAYVALFLGELRSYYERIWWWDIALHASSGLLLGILGFLLVYVLNENRRIDLHMRPRFVALFAFLFALSVGTLWEIFEFAMDNLVGTNMQKPMFGDPSGLTDTMWDLIVDALGALTISIIGWGYTRRGERSFIQRWIEKFIVRNPHLFR